MEVYHIADYDEGFNKDLIILEKDEESERASHPGNSMEFTVVCGMAVIQGEKRHILTPDEPYVVPPREAYTMKALGSRTVLLRRTF